jgi:hypothetical protein
VHRAVGEHGLNPPGRRNKALQIRYGKSLHELRLVGASAPSFSQVSILHERATFSALGLAGPVKARAAPLVS